MRIKVSTTLQWPIERQIPPAWKDEGVEVLVNKRVDECDAWVVYQGLYRPDEAVCPENKVYLFTYEPPGLHEYNPKFIEQFSAVITSHPTIKHPNVIRRHQAQPWLAGVIRDEVENIHRGGHVRWDFDELFKLAPPEKSGEISCICSTKANIPGHQKRLELLDIIARRLGQRLNIFGYGHQPLIDKLDALLPYKFHLVLENSTLENYWTEKLSDAYLGYCFPIVLGCTNLGRYFPKESFVSIDASSAIAGPQVEMVLAEGITASRALAILEARRLVLEEYNLFAEIRRLVATDRIGRRRRIRLYDENLYGRHGWIKPFGRFAKDLLSPNYYRRYMDRWPVRTA